MTSLSALQRQLDERQFDAALITNPDNVFYFTGFRSDPHERLLAAVIFRDAAQRPLLLCPAMEVPDATASGFNGRIEGHDDTENAMEKLGSFLREAGVSSLLIEKNHLTVERMEELARAMPGLSVDGADGILEEMRVIKSDEEIEILQEAAALADYAIEVGCRELAEGKTELEVLTAIELEMKRKGVASMSFSTMVLFGEKAASPHGNPGSRRLKKGDFVLFDLGVIHKGYCSDITRTVAFGEPNEAQRDVYETVRRAEQAAIDAVRPGLRAKELDAIARNVIEEAGYGQWFTHRLGHGLGLSVHEFPSITGVNEYQLKEGMVFTIEPGIYHPEKAGVRIEDDVVVTADGVRVLTKFPKDLTIIS